MLSTFAIVRFSVMCQSLFFLEACRPRSAALITLFRRVRVIIARSCSYRDTNQHRTGAIRSREQGRLYLYFIHIASSMSGAR